jgi:DNA-binding transcriptional regulator/RsmH inhibitor MraZ
VPCAIVHSTRANLKTPVRADSSASRGAAEEKVAVSKILFPKTVAIDTNDKFEIDGKILRVTGIEERKNVLGQLDHFEVDFEMFPA